MRLNVCGLYENPTSGGRHGRGLIRRKHRQRRKNHVSAACGSDDVMFSVKSSATQQPAPQPEHGRALVYVLEQWETKWDNELPPTGFLQGKTHRQSLLGRFLGGRKPWRILFLLPRGTR